MNMSIKILVVDDEPAILDLIKLMLEGFGHQVKTASGGSEAMRMIESGLDFDVILTDVNCPSPNSGDNGIWLARKFSELFPEQSKQTPLLFMTGGMSESQEKEVKTLTQNSIVHKPIDNWISLVQLLTTAVLKVKQPAQQADA